MKWGWSCASADSRSPSNTLTSFNVWVSFEGGYWVHLVFGRVGLEFGMCAAAVSGGSGSKISECFVFKQLRSSRVLLLDIA